MTELFDRLSGLSPEKRLLVERLQQKRRQEKAHAAQDEAAEWAPVERFGLVSADEREVLTRDGADVEDAYPLSMLQQGMVFHMQAALDSAVYHNVDSYHLRGEFDLAALQAAVDAVVARHPMLRTSFDLFSCREPMQLVHREAKLRVEHEDLRPLPSPAQQAVIGAYVAEQRRTSFDLARPPLLRFKVHRLSDNTFQFTLTEHHAIFDGWSLQSTHAEIFDLYAVLRRGEHIGTAEPLRLGYCDFVALERQAMASEECRRYWERKLADRTSMRLPRAGTPAERGRREVRTTYFPFSIAEIEGLKRVAGEAGVALKSVLLAAHVKVMSMLGGTTDVLTGLVTNGRPEAVGGEQIRGLFLNALPLRVALPGGSWLDLVRLAFAAETDLLPFRRYPLVALQKQFGGGQPLFEAAFTYAHFHVLDRVFAQGALEWLAEGSRIAEETNFTISVFFQQYTSPLRLELALSCDITEISGEQAEAAGAYFLAILRAMIADPAARYDVGSFLSASEERQLLAEWNREAAVELPGACLHELFEDQAERRPLATALVCGEARWSYRELNERANRLAHRLTELGVGPEVPVCICCERSLEMVVALLATLKAGGHYVPLDPSHPDDRLTFILADVFATLDRPVLLTTETARATALAALAVPPLRRLTVVPLTDDAFAGESAANLNSGARDDNLAYVIYTSGSTGKPKGALVTHRNVRRLFAATHGWFSFDEQDVWTLFHSYAFDFSVWELWGALAYGGRLLVVPHWLSRSPEDFHRLLVAEGVTVLNQTPSAFRQLVAADQEALDPAAGDGGPLKLRWVIFGGEALDLPSLGPWFGRHGDQSPVLVNMYGITETTVHVTYRELRQADLAGTDRSPIGSAIPDLRLHILDAHGNLAPAGVAGQIFVGGAGLARGYLRLPGLTAESFVPDPFATLPGLRLYRSGDLARRRRDGDLEFLGRVDHQVKIRGFRIELGEIEAVLANHPQVREVALLAFQDREVQQLAAYVVPTAAGVAPAELRAHAQKWLPDYMVPSSFVILEAMPLTANGKLDRQALPSPGLSDRPVVEYVPPETPAELAVARVWEEVLGAERVGVEDDFFALGGDSILSIRVLARMHKLGFELTVPELFQHPVLRDIARHLSVQREAAAVGETAPFSLISEADRALLPEGLEDAYPLARLQAGMIFESSLHPESAVYHDILSSRIRAPFDAELIRRAATQVVAFHPVLRTSFDDVTYSEPLQLVHRSVAIDLTISDIRHLGAAEQEEFLAVWWREEKARPLDLARAPLVRLFVLRRSDTEFQFAQSFHHAILDGWSEVMLLTQLFRLYRAAIRGEEVVEEQLATGYRRFVALELEAVRSEDDRRYWAAQLAGAPRSALPRWPRHAVRGKRTFKSPFPLSLSAELWRFARTAGVPLKTVLLAGHCRMLSWFTGQEEIVTGLVNNGRPEEAGGDRILGLFLNTLPFRLALPDGSWADLVRDTFAAERALLPHRRFPLGELLGGAGGRPPFDAVFGYVHFHPNQVFAGIQDFKLLETEFFEETSFDFSINFGRDPLSGGIVLQLEYGLHEFAPEQVQAIHDRYLAAFSALVRAPEARYREVSLLTAGEAQQILYEWNDTLSETAPAAIFHRLFELQAAHLPESVAVTFGETSLSYAELNRRANRLARRLHSLACGPETRVGIAMERSAELIVALVGVLKAGCAYVPLAPAYPRENLEMLCQDAGVAVLVTQERLRARLPGAAPVLCLEVGWQGDESWAGEDLDCEVDPRQLAYVIYTSGSTGRPKGVLVTHQGLLNYLTWAGEAYEMAMGEGAQVHSPLSSDLTVTSLLLPLLCGRCVHVLPEGVAGEALVAGLRSGLRASLLKVTPSHLQILGERLAGHELAGAARFLVVGGEALTAEAVRRWQEHAPGTRVVNEYGPTETVVGCCVYEAGADRETAGPVPIGRPIANTRLYVLDRGLSPVSAGVPGELFIGGSGVARGYLARPDLTAWRFVPDPWSGQGGARLYRTGDLVRHRGDGNLEFLGRTDQQVKIRGFRVEPGEIEAVLGGHPRVLEAAVTVREDVPGDRRLVGYAAVTGGLSSADLGEWLRARLPEHMVPQPLVVLDRLPLTASGKIDRGALPAPESVRTNSATLYVAPRDELERLVAEIWSTVLGVERVGAHDNFYALGGHSLTAMMVASRLRAACGVAVRVRALFEAPTVAELAGQIRASLRAGEDPAAPPLRRVARPAGEGLPLSFAQQRLWFLDQLEPQSAVYNIPVALRISGPLAVPPLAGALGEIVRRHEALRTSFAAVDGVPQQRAEPPSELGLPVIDLSGLPAVRREAVSRELAAAEAQVPFDLGRGALLRASLVRIAESDHAVFLTMHHIASDGWSMSVLVREVSVLYRALAAGQPSPLPELTLQYVDYAVWQRSWLKGETLEREVSYWRQRLAGAPPVLELPWDRPRPLMHSSRGGQRWLRLPPPLAEGLLALVRGKDATLFMVLLAGFKALLVRIGGQRDVSVGTVVAGRGHLELEGLIGFFVNTLVLRTELGGDPGFLELLSRVRATALGAYAHQELPFEKLVEELAPERSLGHGPLFQVMFDLAHAAVEEPLPEGLALSELPIEQRTAKFDLGLGIVERGGSLAGVMEYTRDLFDPSTVDRLLAQWVELLAGVVARPELRLSQLPLLSPAEQAQVAREWNDTAVARPVASLHGLVSAQAARTPRGVAVESESESLTYCELEERAGRLAPRLRARGVGAEVVVGVCLDRGPMCLVAVLAVLKAGGAYLPLDPDYPVERLSAMLADARAGLVLTVERYRRQIAAAADLPLLLVDDATSPIEGTGAGAAVADTAVAPETAAYVMYTSGSTGRPKGIAVPHRAAAAYAATAAINFRLSPADRMIQVVSMSFDGSIEEIFPALASGATLFIATAAMRLSAGHFLDRCTAWGVTVLSLATAFWHELAAEIAAHPEELPPSLRLVCVGGEKASPERVAEWCAVTGPRVALLNSYGPTEATVVATLSLVEAATAGLADIPLGRPIANVQTYVVGPDFELTGMGGAGELCIGGCGLARGYLGRPGQTAERFVPDPFGDQSGMRLYRTGDRVRWRADGSLIYLGRMDQQVKIRGFRIEPGEIEAVLRSHPRVSEAVVLVRESTPGDRRLAAFVVTDRLSAAGLGAWLRDRLPDHLVPREVVPLDRLPLTPNGKVDRKALLQIDSAHGDESGFVPPRGPVEEMLAEIWSDVLQTGQVGRNDDFFALGGHSLLAMRVVSRLRAAFRVELPVRDLFEEPTLAALSDRVARALVAGGGAPAPPLVRLSRELPLPLSFAQQRLWFLDQLQPGSSAYNMPVALRFVGPLAVAVMSRAMEEIVRRHEPLRTTIAAVDGVPVQRIEPPGPQPLPVVDVAGLPAGRREAILRELVAGESEQPFDLERGPLLRTRVVRLGEAEHAVLLTVHHIASDGWSMSILAREVSLLYRAFVAGEESPLPELPLQYADYAVWQRSWIRGEVLTREIGYWRERLAGAPAVLELPADRPRPAVQSSRGGHAELALPQPLAESLQALAKSLGVTQFMLLLGVWQALLARYSGQTDLSVGSPIAGRSHLETEGLIGFFVNTLVLRTDLGGDPGLREILVRVREVALGAYLHQDLPFEMLVEELAPERSLSHSPLFQVLMVLQNVPSEELSLGDVQIEVLPVVRTTTKFDLTLELAHGPQGLGGDLEYNADLFDGVTAVRLVRHFVTLFEAAVADPLRPLSRLPLLSGGERAQLLGEWNTPAGNLPAEPQVHRIFEAQVERSPEAVAIEMGTVRLSYAETEARANRLARYLAAHGVKPDSRVGICLERSPELPIAVLGILKAGGAYVPLDPSYPQERLAVMALDADLTAVVTEEELRERLLASLLPVGTPIVCVDAEREQIGEESAAPLAVEIAGENLAFVLYTSGSTGRPKGVAMPHGALANLITWQLLQVEERGALRTLQFASLNFDVSFHEMFSTWGVGGTLVLISDLVRRQGSELLRFLHESSIEWLFIPFVALQQLGEAAAEEGYLPRSLREVITAGEQLVASSFVVDLFGGLPDCRLHNHYGPTETHVVTTHTLGRAARSWPTLPPIGRPIANLRIRLLDREAQLVPIGVPGELWIAGEGLARGYLGRPDLTAERFMPDPYSAEPGQRCYRSGDLARYLGDGDIEFLGRLDHQVKVRGFRVEPGEIEAILTSHPAVAEAVVFTRGQESARQLVACLVTRQPVRTPELRGFLGQKLPEYMVPTHYLVVETLPLTPSGKVDRKKLMQIDPGSFLQREGFVAPRGPIEEMVAGIWIGVLGVAQVGRFDDFFALGGHSLLATRVVSRLRSGLRVELLLRDLFEAPTLAALSSRVQRKMAASSGELTPPIVRVARPEGGALPLSFAQQRLWFLDRLAPESPLYNIPLALRVLGSLQAATLGRALSEVVRRHEALRTSFAAVDGVPMQRVEPAGAFFLPIIDLSGLAAARREEEMRGLVAAESERLFDLAAGILLRSTLVRLGESEHAVFLTMHHIASDGWSISVLVREISALYRAFAAGEPGPLAELPLQYADYTMWQRGWLSGDTLEREVGYWRERLAGAPPVLELPVDRQRPSMQSFRGGQRSLHLARPLAERLLSLARRQGATLFMLLVAGFQALLSRLSGQTDVSVGTAVAGRNQTALEELIGFFVNTLVLRTDLGGDPAFTDLLDRVRETALGAYAHQEVPFEKLVEELAPERSLSRTPLFQVMVVLQSSPEEELAAGDLRFQSLPADSTRTAKFDLLLGLGESPQSDILGNLEYSSDLFDATTVERLGRHLVTLLQSAVDAPQQHLASLSLLDEAELFQLLVEWNDTYVPRAGDLRVHALFEAQARRNPEAVALVFEGEEICYRELDRRSNRLAHRLQALGVGPEKVVGLCLERSVAMVVAVLGVLKAGGAYLPLDPTYPSSRLELMVEESGAGVVVTTQEGLSGRVPWLGKAVCLDRGGLFNQPSKDAAVVSAVEGANLSYVIFTSGSTGRPKGVLVSHDGLSNYLAWADGAYEMAAGEGSLVHSPLAFDLTVTSLLLPLLSGRRVHLLSEGPAGEALIAGLRAGLRSSVLKLTPSHLQLLSHGLRSDELAGRARFLVVGGEALSAESLAPWWALAPETRVVNEYGPTETVVGCCVFEAMPDGGAAGPVPIGRPIANTRLAVLDRDLYPVPQGSRGELFVGGAGVARGYLAHPDLTAQSFVPDPYGGTPGARLYRTGDLVRQRSDGNLEFLGRTDQQAKIRGFRIEPGEIEAVLGGHPLVSDTAVLVREDVQGDRRLVAYAVATGTLTGSELAEWLRSRLPEYMVPQALIVLDRLPLTPNGKVDRRALPAPETVGSGIELPYVAPRDELELRLVAIWEDLLGSGPVGVRDDFFSRGGHSLLAVRAMARLQEATGHDLPLATLFQTPTIEGLAMRMRRETPEEPRRALVEIQSGPPVSPLFLIHPVGGEVLCYVDLARGLGRARPIFGLRALQSTTVEGPPARIEDMAESYLAEIRAVYPEGPYRLAGWSMGGLVAFEMARQLVAAGATVDLVAVLDSFAPSQEAIDLTESGLISVFARDLWGISGRHLEVSEEEIAAFAGTDLLAELVRRAESAGVLPPEVKLAQARRSFDVFAANFRAAKSFAGGKYPGRIMLVRSEASRAEQTEDPTLGWDRLAEVDLCFSPGDHFSMVRRPAAQTLASLLTARLDVLDG
jgi:amino acid adenylation domain-containing protein